MKHIVLDFLIKELKTSEEALVHLLEVPPRPELGDFAFPCFSLAKAYKKNPLEISQDLAVSLRKKLPKEITNIAASGPYINFFVDKNLLAKTVLKDSSKKGFGKTSLDNQVITIEFPGPNTNKALHIGHLRNIAIGEAITNISKTVGNTVKHVNIFNDRGILISKSMLAYLKYAKGTTPESERVKPDKFVGQLYTRFSKEAEKNPKLEEEALDLLKKWEEKDPATIELWKKLNGWAYIGMQQTFDTFGLSKIDKNYYESKLYEHGKEIVAEGLKKGIFKKKDDGAVFVNLEKEKLGEKILLRANGTAIYIIQDLYLAKKRIEDFNPDAMLYVVGSEQEYHFKALFAILKKLGVTTKLTHLSYGMIDLPSGKMKSRTGEIVYADDLIENTKKIAQERINERSTKISQKETNRRALIAALAAIKYTFLKADIKRKITFNPKEAVAFEGDTGPYLLYSYARANSISKKVKSKKPVKILDLKDQEIALLKKIHELPEMIAKAYKDLAPNIIANYAFELSKLFNEFYHSCPVRGSPEEGFRLKLVEAFRVTLKKALDLLGIECLEEM